MSASGGRLGESAGYGVVAAHAVVSGPEPDDEAGHIWGQPLTVSHPDQYSMYTYDLRDLVETVSVGKTADDADQNLTSYTYTPRGRKLKETKGNENVVDSAYQLSGTVVASHTYSYDANGNKAKDVTSKMNADDQAEPLDSTTNYAYDPVNRLAKSVKSGNGGSTDTYVHDDNANVITHTVKGSSTTLTDDRNRLLTSNVEGTSFSYNYDPFGRRNTVTSGGKVVERSVYDGFDHVIESQKMNEAGSLESTKYTFDPLDRTASKTDADGEKTDFDYLGTSGEVLDEEVAGELTKSYQYSPRGERLSQIKHDTDGTTEDSYYGYKSHIDVETLTDESGDAKATYGYTAYGQNDDTEFTGVGKPGTSDPTKQEYNPYRCNSKRWDAQTGTYVMGFRDYNPGLNRFTSQDMYNGALADMGLGTDPCTSNRYAFTGGDPTSLVKLEGHAPCAGGIVDVCGAHVPAWARVPHLRR